MFTINLRKELEKSIAQRQAFAAKEQEKAVAYLGQLLQGEAEADRTMLKYFGTETQVLLTESSIKGNAALVKDATLTANEIERVCKKYNLVCLPAAQYKQPIPAHVLNNLRKYISAIKVDRRHDKWHLGTIEMRNGCQRSTTIESELFIIAPQRHFKTTGITVQDPILLFRTLSTLDTTADKLQKHYGPWESGEQRTWQTCLQWGDQFTIIDKWGNDFTILRRLQGLLCYKQGSLWLALVAYLALIITYWCIAGGNTLTMLIALILPIFVLTGFCVHFDKYKDHWHTV